MDIEKLSNTEFIALIETGGDYTARRAFIDREMARRCLNFLPDPTGFYDALQEEE
jgi:hypothetical protein